MRFALARRRLHVHSTAALAFALALAGCAEAPPPETPATMLELPDRVRAQAVDGRTLVTYIDEGDSRLKAAAAAIATRGDEAARRDASTRVYAAATRVLEPEWRDATRPWVLARDAGSELSPTSRQLELQLDQLRDAWILRALDVIDTLGGRESVAYGFELGENEAAPTPIRRAALLVASRHLDAWDRSRRALGAALWARLDLSDAAAAKAASSRASDVSSGVSKEPSATPTNGNVANASSVVAGMASGFRHCYNMGLRQNPDMKGSVRITARIGPAGEVTSVARSGGVDLSPLVISCVAMRVAAASFAAPAGGGATVVIPVTFVTQPGPPGQTPAPPAQSDRAPRR